MRVVMMITLYHPIVGGAERQLRQLAARMTGRGCEVHVVTRAHPGLPRTETIDGAVVHRVAAAGPKAMAATGFVARAALKAASLRPDVIHCHSFFSPAIAGALAKRLCGAPLLIKPMCGGEATAVSRKTMGRRRMDRLLGAADRIVVISREIDAEMRMLGAPPEKLAFIPNGVDLGRFHPPTADEKRRLRAAMDLPDGPLVVFAGRFSPQKRLPFLLEAWRGVAAAAPEAGLLVAGANRRAHAGAAPIDDVEIDPALLDGPGVRRLGHVEDMPALLAAADAFVLPSASEGLSNALLEACASGLAVVASGVGGSVDVIEHGRNGLLFAPDDRAGLEAALLAVCTDPALRGRLGAAARETAIARYDIDATATALLSLYAALRGGQPSATPIHEEIQG